jgi:NADH dehydrogenase
MNAADRKRVVIVGAGFGGLAAAKALGSRDAGSPVDVTVVDRLNYFLFQPLLYQVAMAGLAATDVAYPIRAALHGRQNVSVLLGEVTGVDVAARAVRLDDGTTLAYDYLVMAAGARTSYFGHEDWVPFAPGLKDLDDALEVRRRVLTALESAERAADPAERQRQLTFVVVGGGPTGVELAGAIADLSRDILAVDFKRLDRKAVRVVLVEMADRILTPFDPPLSDKARVQLEELGVDVRTGVRVEAIDASGVRVGGETVRAGTVLWGAGVRPSPLAAALGAPLDRAGRVIVGPDCAVPGHAEVFVIGDMASFTPEGASEPLAGVSPVAMQEARHVARNILDEVAGLPRTPFRYFDKGFMATIGRARAVAQIGPLRMSGLLAWLAWVFLHLWYLVGFRNRLAVFTNWIWAYLISRHGARVITGRRPPAPARATAAEH